MYEGKTTIAAFFRYVYNIRTHEKNGKKKKYGFVLLNTISLIKIMNIKRTFHLPTLPHRFLPPYKYIPNIQIYFFPF